ncbi:Similar to leuS: Leucine--tRNA ligase (Nitrobacter hamburgensis (strain DSM 10229 / NCIMB 13809 / X14)), partial [Cotesia congregata]
YSEEDAVFCVNNGIDFIKLQRLTLEEFQQKRQLSMKKAQEWKIGGYELFHYQLQDQQPVTSPKKLTSDKEIPNLRQAVNWLKISCPKCGAKTFREADTMDTFVDSS